MKIFFLIILAVGLVFPGVASAVVEQEQTRKLMGMPITIRVWGQDVRQCRLALQAAFAELARIEKVFSATLPGSELRRLNETAGQRFFTASREMMDLLVWGQDITRQTRGAFDLSVGGLLQSYGFPDHRYRVPSPAELDKARSQVGMAAVRLNIPDRTIRFLRPGIQLDFGGLAKTHALNRVRGVFRDQGLQAGMMELGGDVVVFGQKPGETSWRIGIQHPRRSDAFLLVLPITAGKVLSSGDYQRFFEQNGQRYHHILNPRTGRPARMNMAATLYLPENPAIDLPSVSLMLLPAEKGVALVHSIPGAECVVVDSQKKIWFSRGWKEKFSAKF